MKRLFVYLLALSFLAGACKSTQKVSDQSSTAPDTLQHALLWKISGQDLETPSYLFGTIHMIESEDFFFPDQTLTSFESSETVVFEIDMKEMTDIGTSFALIDRMFMQNGTTLGDLLNEEEYALVNRHFQEMNLPMMFLERIKPMLLSFFAGGEFSPSDFQSGDIVSYEMKFMEMAEAQNKETAGLETVDFQLSVIDSIPYEAQAEMLVNSIEQMETQQAEFERMMRMYKNQNINALNDMMITGDSEVKPYAELLIHKRNKRWVPKMEDLMLEGSAFFAVGAGHLPGEQGVIQLLRQEGYRVVPVSPVKTSN